MGTLISDTNKKTAHRSEVNLHVRLNLCNLLLKPFHNRRTLFTKGLVKRRME